MKKLNSSKWLLLPVILLLTLLLVTPAMAAEEIISEPVERPKHFETVTLTDDSLLSREQLKAFSEAVAQNVPTCPFKFSVRSLNLPYSKAIETQLCEQLWYNTPEAFNCYSIAIASSGGYVDSVYIYKFYSFADTEAEYTACFAQMETAADYLLEGIEDNAWLTDVEKALLLHDRLAVWTEYDTDVDSGSVNDYPDKDFTAYGALGTRVAVCQGYTMAYMYLLNRVDIYNIYCSSSALCHAWNVVYIEDTPYHVDVTWDDPTTDITGRVWHKNFLRSTDGIVSTGHRATDYNTAPVDTTYDAAYWQDFDAAFQLLDGKLYYIDQADYKIKSISGNTVKDVLSLDPYQNFYSLGSGNGLLLYSTDTQILTYDLVAGTSQVIYTNEPDAENKEWIAGFVYEAGWLNVQIWVRSASYEYYYEDDRVRVTLPEAATKNGWYDGFYYEEGMPVTNAWREDTNGRFYVSAEGTLTVSTWVMDGDNWCYVGEDGYCVKSQWVDDGDGWCYLDENGYMVCDNWVIIGAKTYYCDGAGYRVSGIYTVDGVEYQFSSEGVLIGENEMAIVNHPQPVTVESGATAQFSVKTQGKVKSYRWQYRKIYSWFDTAMEGYNTDTLTVAAVGRYNSYDYRCVVTFADGTVQYSEPAELTVLTYLEITGAPNDQVVVLTYEGQFTVSAKGEGLSYQWQYKRPGIEKWIDTAMEGARKPTVFIESATSRDGYQYRCRVTDITGNIAYSNAATMRVLSFTSHPTEAFAASGDTATFTVKTNVDSGFTYRWQYRRNETAAWSNTTLTGYDTATLQVPAKNRNGYQYRCVITGSKSSKLESQPATLHAGAPVVITSFTESVTASAGDTAIFSVNATNAYSYQWYYCTKLGTTWSKTSMTGATTNTLQVAVTTGRNGYKYRCHIKGLDGNTYYTQEATLTVK